MQGPRVRGSEGPSETVEGLAQGAITLGPLDPRTLGPSVNPLSLVVAKDLGDLGGLDDAGLLLFGFALRRAAFLVDVLLVLNRGDGRAVRGAFLHHAVVFLAVADVMSGNPGGLFLPLDPLLVVALAGLEKAHPFLAEGLQLLGDLFVTGSAGRLPFALLRLAGLGRLVIALRGGLAARLRRRFGGLGGILGRCPQRDRQHQGDQNERGPHQYLPNSGATPNSKPGKATPPFGARIRACQRYSAGRMKGRLERDGMMPCAARNSTMPTLWPV